MAGGRCAARHAMRGDAARIIFRGACIFFLTHSAHHTTAHSRLLSYSRAYARTAAPDASSELGRESFRDAS